MPASADHLTRELLNSRLKLREELVFTPQVHGGETVYHVELPSEGTFYRIGYPEYVLASLLTGQLTVAQALTITVRRLGADALSQAQAEQVIHWLLEHRLAQWLDFVGEPIETPQPGQPHTLLNQFNPFWLKIPLGSPDRLLGQLAPFCGWCAAPWTLLLAAPLALCAALALARHWDAFQAELSEILLPNNWLLLGASWLVLKLLHELGHGLACKYHGGEVREAGLVFVLFAPLAYVDVTSSWRFRSKWQRIHVALAGLAVELTVASAAVFAWLETDSLAARHALANLIVMASVTTVLFNANPLMKFDGYYVLSDLCGIPNLAKEGERAVHNLAARVFYGVARNRNGLAGVRGGIVASYGLLAAAWRLVVCFSLATAAATLGQGAGIVLSLSGLALWLLRPLVAVGRGVHAQFQRSPLRCLRALTLALLGTALTALVLTQLRWPVARTAPVVVDYAGKQVIRSRVDGFVAEICVRNGQPVEADQLLLRLTNAPLEAEHRELELTLKQRRVQQRVALDETGAAGSQIAAEDARAVEQRLGELRARIAALEIRAPRSGRVVSRNLRQRVGSFLREGDEVLVLGDERHKELALSLGHGDLDVVRTLAGAPIAFRVAGGALLAGRVAQLEPRATRRLPHPALGSPYGGPLAVSQRNSDSREPYQLVEPRFQGSVSLPPEIAPHLGVGQRGYALLGLRQEAIGPALWHRAVTWWQRLFRPPAKQRAGVS